MRADEFVASEAPNFVERKILERNDREASLNRAFFASESILAVNVMGSPGAGKTTFIEGVIESFSPGIKAWVIEGDLESSIDAERFGKLGVPALQINTHGGCHLTARMIKEAVDCLTGETCDPAGKPSDILFPDILFIENIGNLVCPSDFDLGEGLRVILLSVPEGDDKVEKYPNIFVKADAVFVTKADLLPFTDFDFERFKADLGRLNPGAELVVVSAGSGLGIRKSALFFEERLKMIRREAAGQ